jgi:hypothetical protein
MDLHQDYLIWKHLLRQMLTITRNIPQVYDFHSHHPDYYLLCRRITPWPTDVDSECLLDRQKGPDHIRKHSSKSYRVKYVGNKLGKDRAIVSNNHFPCILQPLENARLIDVNLYRDFNGKIRHKHANLTSNEYQLIMSSAPFTKAVKPSDNASLEIVLSCICYFECSIFPPEIPPSNYEMEMGNVPCISVGIACPSFPLRRKQPGWDRFSFGYHGDDGNFFHGDGIGEPMGPSFGVGDTIGCGIIYQPLSTRGCRLFFTKNGEHVGAYVLQSCFATLPWFPIVGLDSYSPVELNYGHRPFVFDIQAFELQESRQISHIALQLHYYNFIRDQEVLLLKDKLRCKITQHPVLHGSSRYSVGELSRASFYLNNVTLRNTKFLLDLMYLENLAVNSYVNEEGHRLNQYYMSQEDLDMEDEDDSDDEEEEDDDLFLLEEEDEDDDDDEALDIVEDELDEDEEDLFSDDNDDHDVVEAVQEEDFQGADQQQSL